MTNKELQDLLSKLPPEAEIGIFREGFFFGDLCFHPASAAEVDLDCGKIGLDLGQPVEIQR